MSSEEDIIRKRLLVEGESGQDDRRIMGLLKSFLRWCNSEQLSSEENEATLQKMLFTLNQIEFSFSKTEMVMMMTEREQERYEQLASDIKVELLTTQKMIIELREQLRKGRQIRQHRQECDAMARVIQQHPERLVTMERINQLERMLTELTEQHRSVNEHLETRRKQGHLLVVAIHQLMGVFQGDDVDDTAMDTG